MTPNKPGGAIEALLARSNRLGADPRTTNFGGGNTSAKAMVADPVTNRDVEVMWVKGSGGDLGSLRAEGLAALDVGRVRELRGRYAEGASEDDIHDLLDSCRFGVGGALPSIDTTMHALLPVPHVDHLHPDAVISIAAAADGEELTKRCFGEEMAWIPWIRPGFELALRIEEIQRTRPEVLGVILGGHGLTAWAASSDECEQTSLDLIERADAFIRANGRADPLGGIREGFAPLPERERARRAATLGPLLRGLASTDRTVVSHWTDDPLVLDFVARKAAPRVVPMGTSCPDHFIRTKVRPLLLDLPADADPVAQAERLRELHKSYRAEYAAYYERYADAGTPPMRGADPAIVLIPGVGMFSFGEDAREARIAGEFYINAINVIRGAEAISSYAPVPEPEKFRVEYWKLEERKLRHRPRRKPLTSKVAIVTGAGSGIGRAIAERFREEGAVVAVVDIDEDSAKATAERLDDADATIAIRADVTDEGSVVEAFNWVLSRYGGVDIVVNNAGLSVSRALLETSVDDWDRQHDVLARGSFLVSREAARAMVAQGTGGDIVYVVSKNAIVAGPDNVAYGSAKASQAHQVRLLAAELGAHGIRVNGINPDGVVQGSGIFAGGWGAERAKVYGIKETDLGAYYASRTLLKAEVLPAHVADAAFCLVSGELPRTTGLIIPVDGGLASGFLR